MRQRRPAGEWILVPSSTAEIDALRKKCERLVMRRAAVSAGVSAVPIPGLDIATDISLLMRLIDDINCAFGLTPEQIERLQPKAKVVVYQAVTGLGSVLVGKLITREVVARMLRHAGMKAMLRHSAKMVPLAGQVASAALGFTAFRAIGYQHIDACAKVAEELMVVQAAPAG